MKILVLGNGFDIDHNLPTKYSQFLDFCNYISGNKCEVTKKQLEYIDILKKDKDLMELFLSYINDNNLLYYLNQIALKRGMLGENWIDFEREIKIIVNCIKEIETEFNMSKKCSYKIGHNHLIYELLEYAKIKYVNDEWNDIVSRKVYEDLYNSFVRLVKAFELYVVVFINNTEIEGVAPDIVEFDADNVLTFNYSSTYERVYGGARWKEYIDHVHGKAKEKDKEKEDPNIIIGITSETDFQSSYVEFEKFYQRIIKKTGEKYKEWIQVANETNDKIEVAFFGHSLDSSDRDIIMDLIENNKSIVSIYYYDEPALHLIVANLIEIIGKEKLIKYVYGNKPKIKLIPQKKHISDNTAGVEIARDLRMIYRLHMLSNNEIEELLSKIRIKILQKDLSYFYSQKKAISIFDSLKDLGVEDIKIDDFIAICRHLDFEESKSGKPILLDEEEWYEHTPWDKDIPCCEETRKLVNEVNKANEIKYSIRKAERKFGYLELVNTSEDLKNALISIFEEQKTNDEYWKQLSELIVVMLDNKLLHDAIQLMTKEKYPIPIQAKVKHFIELYEDIKYNAGYEKHMAETNQYEE